MPLRRRRAVALLLPAWAARLHAVRHARLVPKHGRVLTPPSPHSGHLQKVIDQTGQIRHELIRQLIAEFMGVLLFQIFGGAAPPKDTTAPAANGFALVAIIYAFANISGAHLNPAVTFALMCTGHMKWWKGLLYVIVQVGEGSSGTA